MTAMPAPITADVHAEWLDPAEGAAPVRLVYDPAVPLEVRVQFPHLPADYAWAWARDIWRTALDGPAGHPAGDVLMWRSGEHVKVLLRATNNGGTDTTIAFRRREVAAFLHRTVVLVPYGREAVAVPDTVADLLRADS